MLEFSVLATENRPVAEISWLQDLPSDFDITSFTRSSLVRAIGNGVPYGVALAVAEPAKNTRSGVAVCACSSGLQRQAGHASTMLS
jgi:hypothetical protein